MQVFAKKENDGGCAVTELVIKGVARWCCKLDCLKGRADRPENEKAASEGEMIYALVLGGGGEADGMLNGRFKDLNHCCYGPELSFVLVICMEGWEGKSTASPNLPCT